MIEMLRNLFDWLKPEIVKCQTLQSIVENFLTKQCCYRGVLRICKVVGHGVLMWWANVSGISILSYLGAILSYPKTVCNRYFWLGHPVGQNPFSTGSATRRSQLSGTSLVGQQNIKQRNTMNSKRQCFMRNCKMRATHLRRYMVGNQLLLCSAPMNEMSFATRMSQFN